MSEVLKVLATFYAIIGILFTIGFYISTVVKSEDIFKEFNWREALYMPLICGLVWPLVVYYKIRYG